jgi:DNA-binding NarL/FixJ family response regulator
MKQEAPEQVVSSIRRVLNGEIYVSEKMSSKLLAKMADGGANGQTSPLERLSDRELEVFQLIGHGFRTRQIAEKLCLSIKTIESYREHIKEKLNLENSTELFQHALHWVQGQAEK